MPLPWAATFPIPPSTLVSAFRGDYNNMLTAVLTAFTGPDEPPQLFASMWWVDTSKTPKELKQRNSSNTAWILKAYIDQDWGGMLPLSGGTMQGPIDMNAFGLLNLPLGSGNAAARYTDLAAYAKLGLGTDAAASFAKIPDVAQVTGSKDPATDDQLSRKKYVDDASKAGGTFTGQITMPIAPAAASQQLTRKIDLEGSIDAHTHSGAAGQGPKIPPANLSVSGGTEGDTLRLQGSALIYAAPAVVQDAAAPQLINTSAASGGFILENVSAYVPARARIAILKVAFTGINNNFLYLDLRKNGGTDYTTYYAVPFSGWTEIAMQLLVELDSAKRFQWRTRLTGVSSGNTHVDAWLAGYI